jgi:beta-mannosidase
MQTVDLTSRSWTLQSWRPFSWYLQRSVETSFAFPPCNGPIPATVPGSALTALRKAGLVKDWNVGRNSLDCEWVEHRHWEFFTDIEAGTIPRGERVILEADGLDYSGWICIGEHEPIPFSGALRRHEVDLTKALSDGASHRLRIIFDAPPEEQGQVGFTSHSRWFKPRFSFSWDWCPRLVPVGIWDSLRLKIGTEKVRLISHYAELNEACSEGQVTLGLRNETQDSLTLTARLTGPDNTVYDFKPTIPAGLHKLVLKVEHPELWWPNGHGGQILYRLELFCEGELLHEGAIGFKKIRWLPSKSAPSQARPLLCEVNGKPIFIQGINWTPVNLDYHDLCEDRYRRLIALYVELGINVLRVWGGAYLERDLFYSLCDAAGLMVWQEFPLCSSGCDSCPPESPEFLRELSLIAVDYVRRRCNHACLLLWCGGNELQTHKDAEGKTVPLTEAHPAMRVLRDIVQSENPGIRFLPTSPSGPLFARTEETSKKGLHHHVHAPWDSKSTVEEWKKYWDTDDAIFRAECGVTGTSSLALIQKYAGDFNVWPCSLENPLWKHSASFWMQPQLLEKVQGIADRDFAVAEMLRMSRERQAEFLAYAVKCCKDRFPTCTGFMIWMGHDCFPILNNTSLIEFDLEPKPAFYALKDVFREDA